uniref:hypothetical protein n=1 Tax=Amycolatopsis benzoatilytica TaxID=346045 RepID=UPI0037CC62B4
MSTAPDGGPDNRTPDRARQLLDLAEDLRKVRGEVGGVRTTVVDLASTVSEFGPQLLDVQRDVNSLRGVVEELATARAESENAPVDWFHLSAADAEKEWPKLGDWVHEILSGWYLVTREKLPDCWALHRPAFLQVAWLRSSGIEAYLAHSHPSQAAEFNTRWLDAALAKIAEHIPASRCRAAAGRPGDHLVDQLEAQQQGHRAQAQQPAAGPGTGSNPYPNPYAQPAQAPAPTPAAPSAPSGRVGSSAGQEVIRPEYWGGYFNQAMQADLAWRRERDKALAEKAAAEAAEKDGSQTGETP